MSDVKSDAKITFVVCDDEQRMQESHALTIMKHMENVALPYEIRRFDDGLPVEVYLYDNDYPGKRDAPARGHAKGVILITDGQMGLVHGDALLKDLSKAGCLPTNCAVCTSGYKSTFDYLISRAGLDPKTITYISKSERGSELPKFIERSLPSAAAEVGLVYTASARPANGSTGARPDSSGGPK